MPRSRNISTTTPLKAATKSRSTTPQKQDDTASMNDEEVMTTGPEISSKRVEAEAFEEPTKEQLNAAPGLPESGKVEPSSAGKLSVKLPGPHAEETSEQVIVSFIYLGHLPGRFKHYFSYFSQRVLLISCDSH